MNVLSCNAIQCQNVMKKMHKYIGESENMNILADAIRIQPNNIPLSLRESQCVC